MKTFKEMEEMGDEPFRELVRKTVEDIYCTATSFIYNKGREIDVFFSDGYDTPSHRTIFFCIKGSNNKFYGYIQPETETGNLAECCTSNITWVGYTNLGKFKTDWVKVRCYGSNLRP